MSLAAGLEISAEQLALLHRSYWAAFVASRIKGMADRAAEEGDDFQPAPSASPAVGGAAGTEGQPLLTADRARRLQQAAIVRASALLVSMGNASAMSARRS